MIDTEEKGPESDEWSLQSEEQFSPVEPGMDSTPVIADSSAPLWIKYCEDRLRHFAVGR